MAKQIAVLGAGLAGLSFSYHFPEPVEVYEQESQVGGVCRSFSVQGYAFDYGQHLLHGRSSYIKDLLITHNPLRWHHYTRKAEVFLYGNTVRAPLQAYLYDLPPSERNSFLQDYINAHLLKARYAASEKINFETWARHICGERLYSHFLKPYNEKLWGIKLQELSLEWTKHFFPVVNLETILAHRIKNKEYPVGYNQTFWYPVRGGINAISQRLAEKVKNINTHHRVNKIDYVHKRVYFENGNKARYEILVNSLPLVELGKMLTPLPSSLQRCVEKLRYVSILTFCIVVRAGHAFPWQWKYYPEKKYIFYRIGNASSYSSGQKGTMRLYGDVAVASSCNIYDETVQQTFSKKVVKDLCKAGIIKCPRDIILMHPVALRFGYVVCDHYYAQARTQVLEFLKIHDIYSIGRYGAWKYMSMEDVILEGRDMANSIAEKIST